MDIATLRSLPASEQAAILSRLPPDKQKEFAKAFKTLLAWEARNRFHLMFPKTGKFRLDQYQKHQEFFRLGATKRARLFLGGTGTGKTEGAGGYEAVCHLTGLYPDWWEGKRFTRPVSMWIGANTNETFRDSVQLKLFGKREEWGTGLIPGALLGKPHFMTLPADTLDNCPVKHVSGGWSKVKAKTYKGGASSFESSDIDVIWLDEEPDIAIVSACSGRFRGRTAGGILYMTYTPFEGITEVVQKFVPQFMPDYNEAAYVASGNAVVIVGAKDVPHATPDPTNFSAIEREARINGIPSSGAGKVYQVPESEFVIDPFVLPRWFPRAYGADFGFGSEAAGSGTGAVWGALDRENDVLYLYAEYMRAEQPPSVHAAAIKSKGSWIAGAGDYAGSDLEGRKTLSIYRDLGLDILPADKSVGPGLQTVTERITQGRLKVFRTCSQWLTEYRLYSFDERNRIVKKRDHLMDATRYLVMSGLERARTQVVERPQHIPSDDFGL